MEVPRARTDNVSDIVTFCLLQGPQEESRAAGCLAAIDGRFLRDHRGRARSVACAAQVDAPVSAVFGVQVAFPSALTSGIPRFPSVIVPLRNCSFKPNNP